MSRENLRDGTVFEAEVRHIARQIWTTETYSGPINIDGMERDGIFVLEDQIHCIECTISRELAKTKHDLDKLAQIVTRFRSYYKDKIIKGWFITLDEPSGHQGSEIAKHSGAITHQTFDQFQARIIDAKTYLSLRRNYSFGSARLILGEGEETSQIPENEFVDAEVYPDGRGRPLTPRALAQSLTAAPARTLIQGEYGVGKSMFLRQLFFELEKSYKNKTDYRFPIYINLRDHREESDPDVALHRHARAIGFEKYNDLIRGWRAGYSHVILDGFDELPPRIGGNRSRKAQDIRKSALQIVRKFVDQSPGRGSVVIAGRSNFFDRDEELRMAIGVKEDWKMFSLGDFSEQQAESYLKKRGLKRKLPNWLPRRPLLVAYFVSRKLISNDEELGVDIGEGWSRLIDAICERETKQIDIGVYPDELRKIYQLIATKARKKAWRVGPVSFSDSREAFREVMQMEPEERATTALLRLPGMSGGKAVIGSASSREDGGDWQYDSGDRWFIDEDFLDAVAAGLLGDALAEPYTFDLSVFDGVQHQLGEVGIDVVRWRVSSQKIPPPLVEHCLTKAADRSALIGVDIFHVLGELEYPLKKGPYCISGVFGIDILIGSSELTFSEFVFRDCFVRRLAVYSDGLRGLPKMESTHIARMRTCLSREEVQRLLVDDCICDEVVFTDSIVNGAGKDELEPELSALVSILDKVFIQSINGRRETALFRGLSAEERSFVPQIIEELRRAGAIYKTTSGGNILWHPSKGFAAEASRIVRGPRNANSKLVEKILQLSG